MSLISNTDSFKLPFKSEHPEPYALSGNRIFVINENWEYVIRDGLNKSTVYKGKFDEDPKLSTIINIYSYWFYELSYSRLFYYSPTHKVFRIYNFET